MKVYQTILLLFITSIVVCQAPIFNPVDLSLDYNIRDMQQDELGFLWLATDKGIVFYNGFEDRIIGDTSVMHLNAHTLSLEGSILYVGMSQGHILKVNAQSRTPVDLIKLNSEARISSIWVDGEGSHYFSTYGDGLYIITASDTIHINESTGLSSNYIYEMVGLGDGRLMCATDRGVNVVGKNLKIINLISDLPDILVTNLIFKNDSTLWASCYDKGVFSINTYNYNIRYFAFEEKMIINDLKYYDDELWISTDMGLYSLLQEGNFQLAKLPDDHRYKKQSILFDDEHNLWLGGNQNPLWKASMFFRQQSLALEKEIQSISAYNGNLILGTNEGVYKINNQDKNITPILDGINTTVVKNIAGLLWIGSYSQGLYIIDIEGKILAHLDRISGLIDNSILDIEMINDGTVMVSTLAGMVVINIDLTTLQFNQNNSINLTGDYYYVLDIYFDGLSTTWLGKDKAGLSYYSQKQKSSPFDDELKKLGSVFSINKLDNGSLWVSSTKGGVLKISSDTIENKIPLSDESETYTSIIPLKGDNMLLVRTSGIDLYDGGKEHIMYFNKELNLTSNQPYLNNYVVENDVVWFVHSNNIYSFHMPPTPQKIHPLTSLDKIEVNLDEMPNDKYQFGQSENNFRFSFTGAWMTDPQKISYTYFLEGYDNEWRYTQDRVVSYPHLPPGKYTFNVKSAENDKFSDEPITSYTFNIKKAFHNTVWFYLLLSGLLGAAGYFLIKRDQRERALKAELSQKKIETQLINLKSQLNPHFLFNSFNTLIGLIEEDTDRGVKYVEHLTDFYRAILEIGKEELIPLSKELHLVELYSFLLKERFGKGLIVNISKPVQEEGFIPPLTLQMLIENAVKHNIVSEKQKLHITINSTDDHIEVANNLNLKISKQPSTSIGLQNIKRRYLLLSGKSIEIIQSGENYTIRLPLIT